MLGGYRVLRRLASGDRADVHLAVAVQAPSGSPDLPDPDPALVVLRVYDRTADDDAIATEIDAMELDATGTTPRLIDVVTLPDHRACLIVERIGGGSLASLLADGRFAPGQVVTALAPLVVGLRELARRGFAHTRLSASDVLVDETGRPRLIGLGALERIDAGVPASVRTDRARRAHAALAALMEEVADASTGSGRFAAAVELARTMLTTRPFAPDHEALERALFAVADPTPLVAVVRADHVGSVPSRLVTAPLEAGAAAPVGEPVARHLPSAGAESAGVVPGRTAGRETGRSSAARRLAEIAQLPGIADDLGNALDGRVGAAARRRLHEWFGRRPAVLATGGLVGVGALVLLLTAVPPAAAGGDPSTIAAPSHVVTSGPTDGPDPAPSSDADRIADDPDAGDGSVAGGPEKSAAADPAAEAAGLLEIRAGCLASRDPACVAAYAQPGSPIEARDLAAIVADEPSSGDVDLGEVTIAADLGDAVVLRVPGTGEREPASLLMMRSEAGWRLREWFD